MFVKSKYTLETNTAGGDLVICNLLYKTKAIIPCNEHHLKNTYLQNAFEGTTLAEKLLIENRFYVDSAADETLVAEKAKEKALIDRNRTLNLTIKPTVSCNLECIYCWEKSEQGLMTPQTAKNLVKFIDKKVSSADIDNLVINWFGGEPMLAYDTIIQIMQDVGKICKKNCVPYVGLMSTNGTLLTSEKIHLLLKHHVYSYQITLDGTKTIHDSCRPFKQKGKSSFDTIVKNLISIRDQTSNSYLEIIVRVNVTKDFIPVRKEFLDFYKFNFGRDKRFSLLLEDVTDKGGERISSVKGEIINTDLNRDVLVEELLNEDIIQHNFMNYTHGSMMCHIMLDNSYNINYDGTCYLCELLSDKGNTNSMNTVGKINACGECFVDPHKVQIWRSANDLPECSSCKLYPICCGGLCPLSKRNIQECRYVNNLETLYNSLRMLGKEGQLKVLSINDEEERAHE